MIRPPGFSAEPSGRDARGKVVDMVQRTREQNSIELLVERRRPAHLLCIDTDAACLSHAIRIGIDRGYLQPVSDQQCRKLARSAADFEYALARPPEGCCGRSRKYSEPTGAGDS